MPRPASAFFLVKSVKLSRLSNASIGPTVKVTGGTIVGSLRAGDSFGERAGVYGGVHSATVVTDPPCELFCLGLRDCARFWEMIWLPVFKKSCGSLVFKQSSVMSHFSSAQQLEIVRVMETSSDAAGESVAQGLRFCVVVDGDVSGSRIQTVRSRWRLLRFSVMSSGRRPCDDARQVHAFAQVQHIDRICPLVPVVMQRQVRHYGWCGGRRRQQRRQQGEAPRMSTRCGRDCRPYL